MSAAARVTLADLVQEERVEQIPVDPEVCDHLLTQATNHLRTVIDKTTATDAVDIGGELLDVLKPAISRILEAR